ncbi:helix-turn-helix transcriptional regulator [Candidatus Micrarchaeota archaeon]|nr:helix-turn-helix transcriptional regulator [Candidatus Micrarchaeota archaeon]
MHCSPRVCPIVIHLDVFEKKWALKILTEIYEGKTHFNEIKRGLPKITPQLLSKRLKELEAAGLLVRKEAKGDPLVVEYYLNSQSKEIVSCWEAKRNA